MRIILKWLKDGLNILRALRNFPRRKRNAKSPFEGWTLRPKERIIDEREAIHQANMASAAKEYLQETFDAYAWRLFQRMASEPPTLENMLVLKGEAKALFLLLQGIETSITQGEEAR